MKKEFIKTSKEKLEQEKTSIEAELGKFAVKDKNLEGDWDTKYPKFDGRESSKNLEEAADEVEEYSNRLSVEFSLENRLKDIEAALEKIKKNKFGRCEKCAKAISLERLKVYPEARTCSKCK